MSNTYGYACIHICIHIYARMYVLIVYFYRWTATRVCAETFKWVPSTMDGHS